MYNFDNYSNEYKTRRILDLDKILLMLGMHDMCMYASHTHSLSNFGLPMYFSRLVYMQADHNLGKINHFTFWGSNYPKCKLEHAKHDSHCITQQVNEIPSFIPVSWYQMKPQKSVKSPFLVSFIK